MKNYDLPRSILGRDFISPEEVMNCRNTIIYTDEQLAEFMETVPTQEVLEWCNKNNYMLVAGPNCPMSVLEIRTIEDSYFYSSKDGWYAQKEFSKKDKATTRWYMIRKNPVPGSTSKNWEQQNLLISDVETVPNVAEFVWGITTYKAVRTSFLFSNVRTSSFESEYGAHVCAGFGNHGFIHIFIIGNDESAHFNDIGLSAARKVKLKREF